MPIEVSDDDFIAMAKDAGLVDDAKIAEVKKVQAEAASKGFNMKLSKILVMRGMISPAQAEEMEKKARPQTVKFARFELMEKVREDSQGATYRAFYTHNPKLIVTLKLMDEKLFSDPEATGRFLRASEILRATKHPNIICALEKGEFQGRPYVVMEYSEGELLSDVLQKKTFLDEATVLKMGLEIASALDLMNKRGLIHRDIKPTNILLTPQGVFRLTDLGLAKYASSEIKSVTLTSKPLGTPAYMAPEFLMDEKDLDIKVDIYGLGASMFHALTGKKPFESDNPIRVMAQIKDQPVPDAQAFRKEVSEPMSRLLRGMMAKDRKDRYGAKIDDLLDDMRVVSKGVPPKHAK